MNNYQIYEEVGKGRNSIVYKGRRKKSIEYYAIASIDKSQRKRCLNSVKFLRTLSHKQILRFHNWYETNNHFWVITEYCTGGDLRSIIELDNSFPETTVKVLGNDLVEGLMYIHSQGVLYADLKPSNILMDSSARLRFYDFGLALHVDDAGTGGRVGTPSYMAPELFSDRGVHSFASDLWSLGCILYEMAAGKPPFSDTTLEGLMHQIVTDPIKRIDSFSAEFNELLEGLLTKDPVQRATWSDVVGCELWSKQLVLPTFPPEPAFERFVGSQKGTCSRENEKKRNDILRASLNAQRNLARELKDNGGYQNEGNPSAFGIPLDREVDFSDPQEEEPSEEAAANNIQAPPERPVSAGAVGVDDGLGAGSPVVTLGPIASGPASRANSPPLQTHSTGHTVEALLFHPSDYHVRSIVMNSKIERFLEPKFEAADLPFPCRTIPQLKQMTPKELEGFLTAIYRSLASTAPISDKHNILCYFESLCCDTQIANVVVNSTVSSLCVKILAGKSTPPPMKALLATVIGLLLRHATFVHSELQKTNVISVLISTFHTEPTLKTRRRTIACLGELLFYIAAQPPQERTVWDVPMNDVVSLYRRAVADEDEIVRHYATKLIENIASISDRAFANYFATTDIVEACIGIYYSGQQVRSEHLKQSALCSALRLCFANPILIPTLMNLLNPTTFGEVLFSNSGKTAQVLLTFCNFFLCKAVVALLSECGERHMVRHVSWSAGGANSVFSQCSLSRQVVVQTLNQLISNGNKFMSGLALTIEHSVSAIRAKAVLCVLLLTVVDPGFLSRACEFKVFACLEKLTRDKDTHVAQAMSLLYQLLSFFVGITVLQLAEQSKAKKVPTELQGDLVVVLHILTCPTLKSNIEIEENMIQSLATCMFQIDKDAEFGEYQKNLMLLLELFHDKKIIAAHHRSIIDLLLTSLTPLISSAHGNTRFCALREIFEFVSVIVNDTALFNPAQSTGSDSVAALNKYISSLLPQGRYLLVDDDPIPVFFLKLLSSCTEKSIVLVSQIAQTEIIDTLVEFLDYEHRNHNVHVIRILVRALQTGGEALMLKVASLHFMPKLVAVIKNAQKDSLDEFLDAAFEGAFFFLSAATKNATLAMECGLLANEVESILLPVCAAKQSYSECAGSCLYCLSLLFLETRQSLVSPKNFAVLRELLGDFDEESTDKAKVLKELVRALLVAVTQCPFESVAAFQREEVVLVQLQMLAQNTVDKALADLSSQVLAALYRRHQGL